MFTGVLPSDDLSLTITQLTALSPLAFSNDPQVRWLREAHRGPVYPEGTGPLLAQLLSHLRRLRREAG